MPKEVFGRDYRFLDRRELLTFEEIERLAHAFVANGIEKIRTCPTEGPARSLAAWGWPGGWDSGGAQVAC